MSDSDADAYRQRFIEIYTTDHPFNAKEIIYKGKAFI
jgi:hypothetical protein